MRPAKIFFWFLIAGGAIVGMNDLRGVSTLSEALGRPLALIGDLVIIGIGVLGLRAMREPE
jgi:hypothetical protein